MLTLAAAKIRQGLLRRYNPLRYLYSYNSRAMYSFMRCTAAPAPKPLGWVAKPATLSPYVLGSFLSKIPPAVVFA